MRPERMIEYTAGTHAKQGNHGSEAIWSAARRLTLGARACTNLAVARRVPTPTAQARAARAGQRNEPHDPCRITKRISRDPPSESRAGP